MTEAVENERYHRQKLIGGWDQTKLFGASIAIVGEGRLADYLALDLLSFGFGNIKRIGSYKSPNFQFREINPEVKYEECFRLPLYAKDAVDLTEKSHCIIDCTNSPRVKSITELAASKNNALYLSAFASDQQFRFHTGIPSRLETLACNEQGEVPSMLGAALIAEELRKRFMPLENDICQDSFTYSLVPMREAPINVVQIGAGAIGTFSALALASLGARLTIIDHDVVVKSNLNRQCLFFDNLGQNKAEALARRLGELGYKAKGVNEKIGADFNPSPHNLIVGCVDNMEARNFMDSASRRYNIPLIDSGSSLTGCNVFPLIPGRTQCLDCQYMGKISEFLREQNTPRAAGACFHPSIITSNQVAAALIANVLQKVRLGNPQNQRYQSGVGIFSQEVDSRCDPRCLNREQK